MVEKDKEGLIMQRVRNQLRIHWHWLKEKDYNEVADFIGMAMRQALAIQEKNEKGNRDM